MSRHYAPKYDETVAWIRSKCPPSLQHVHIAVICGSGLSGLVDSVDKDREKVVIPYKDIPHFATSTVQGHPGNLVLAHLNSIPTAFMVGRFHFYEGHDLALTTYPVRVLALLGVHTLIVTNAAGGLNEAYVPGDVMAIKDHISVAGLGGRNPLIGANEERFGPRFPAMSDAYDPDLRRTFFRAVKELGMQSIAREGTYCYVAGPSYETRGEARLLVQAGGDAVGMSTAPEVVAARHAGIRVLGISLITNRVPYRPVPSVSHEILGTPVPPAEKNQAPEQVVNHEEVLEVSAMRAKELQGLVRKIFELLPPPPPTRSTH
ncbi:inosine guanosine and [Gonapodya prolifera JEL478]|uniref:Purine nucleoside phosphorylase n=1 Tax=Gonapodya prolifera (strain JEL478) TaxID=1344416 RepID=A0A139ADC4_GONPJ|nr:inosine guanosine and [Gonapodya prolifera JEL478]|eukprot:KXS14826.1 inosine guanosine and [Gonapodya prolifera JEL478]